MTMSGHRALCDGARRPVEIPVGCEILANNLSSVHIEIVSQRPKQARSRLKNFSKQSWYSLDYSDSAREVLRLSPQVCDAFYDKTEITTETSLGRAYAIRPAGIRPRKASDAIGSHFSGVGC